MGPEPAMIDPFAQQIFGWLQGQPLVSALIITMTLDICSGLAAAVVRKVVCSTASWQGMSKKALIWIVVCVAAVVGHLSPQIPVVNMVCGFYVYVECISILENAGRAGVPLPEALLDVLRKLKVDVDSVVQTAQPAQVSIKDVGLVNFQPSATVAMSGDPITGPRGLQGPAPGEGGL